MADYSAMTPEECFKLYQDDPVKHEAAFTYLFGRQESKLYQTIHNLISRKLPLSHHYDDHHDVANTVLLKMAHKAAAYDGSRPLYTYVWSVTVNAINDHFRGRQRQREQYTDDVDIRLQVERDAAQRYGPYFSYELTGDRPYGIIDRELINLALDAFRAIKNDDYYAVLFARFCLNLDFADIADLIEKKEVTVRTYQGRALREVHGYLVQQEVSPRELERIFNDNIGHLQVTPADIDRLPPELRGVARERFLQGKSLSALARQFKTSISEVRSRLNAALRLLLNCMVRAPQAAVAELGDAELCDYTDKLLVIGAATVRDGGAQLHPLLATANIIYRAMFLTSNLLPPSLTFGGYLEGKIGEAGLDEAAAAHKLGIDLSKLIQYLSDVDLPDTNMREKMAAAFGLSREYTAALIGLTRARVGLIREAGGTRAGARQSPEQLAAAAVQRARALQAPHE